MGADQSRALATTTRTFSQSGMSPLVRSMHFAVMQNDVVKLTWTIRLGVDVNQPWANPAQPSSKDGYTALSQAISLNHVEIAKCLIAADARLDLTDRDGYTPLMKAVYHGRHVICKMLIDAGRQHAMQMVWCMLSRPSVQVLMFMTPTDMATLYFTSAPRMGLFTTMHCASRTYFWVVAMYLTPLYHCMKPVLEMERQPQAYLLRAAFRKQLRILKRLLRAGSDSLGLASWIAKHQQLTSCLHEEQELLDWFENNRPESLKHVCRVYIQNQLGFTDVRHKYCIRKVRKMDIPDSLKHYLCRRLLPL